MENSKPHEIKGLHLLTFNLAACGNTLVQALFNGYIYYYYVYVIGLDSLLTSMGVFIAGFIYAVVSPIIGVLSDNKPLGRFGKRKPFLLFSLPFIAIPSVWIWMPPSMCQPGGPINWETTLFFWAMCFAINFGSVILNSPYAAMIPEQCETEKNRVDIAAIQGLFNIVGIIIGIVFPILLQSTLNDGANTLWNTDSGQYLMKMLPRIALILTIIAVIFIIITYISIDEKFLGSRPIEKKSVKEFFGQLFSPFKHEDARWFLGISLFSNIAARIMMTVLLPIMTIVVLIQGPQYYLFIGVLIPMAIGSLFFWQKIIQKWGLLKTYRISYLIAVVPCCLSVILLLNLSQITKLIASLIIIGFALASLIASFLIPTPVYSAIIDEGSAIFYADKMGPKQRISGVYFGINNFVINMASAFANIILGIIYTGGKERDPFLLVMSLPITAIFFFLSWYCVKQIKLRGLKNK